MIAVTPKELERERVNAQRFDQFALAVLRELGEQVPAGKGFTEHFDQQPAGKPSLLAELRRDAEVVSVLSGARVQPQSRPQKPQYVLSSTSLMLLRGKLLSLEVYGAYESPADLEWIRAITVRWIDELQRLNAR
jgi:hypothetical protein